MAKQERTVLLELTYGERTPGELRRIQGLREAEATAVLRTLRKAGLVHVARHRSNGASGGSAPVYAIGPS